MGFRSLDQGFSLLITHINPSHIARDAIEKNGFKSKLRKMLGVFSVVCVTGLYYSIP